MIFRQWEKVLSKDKTQTRRLRKPSHSTIPPRKDSVVVVRTNYVQGGAWRSRTLWVVGKNYAVQPPGEPGSKKRGEKSVGRITIEGIHSEPLQDISDEDLIKEGFYCYEDIGGAVLDELQPDREAFIEAWDNMYKGEPDYRWNDNPVIWVIDFRLAYAE